MGRVDLFHSRRTKYHECPYYIRDERDSKGSPSEWVNVNQVSGSFFGKISSVKSSQMNTINGLWANDNHHITLETDDDIDDICRGSIVKFDDELWIVEGIQREEHLKESQFSKHIHWKYYVALKRG